MRRVLIHDRRKPETHSTTVIILLRAIVMERTIHYIRSTIPYISGGFIVVSMGGGVGFDTVGVVFFSPFENPYP